MQLQYLRIYTQDTRYVEQEYKKRKLGLNIREMAVKYQDKIKFKIVFAFMVLDFIAWLNHPKGSNFYSIYLFLTLNRPLITWQEEKNRSSST